MLPEPQPDTVQTQIASNEKAVTVTVSTPKSSHVEQQGAQSVKSQKPVETKRCYPLRIQKQPEHLYCKYIQSSFLKIHKQCISFLVQCSRLVNFTKVIITNYLFLKS